MRSRADLRLINTVMGNHRWLERTLAQGGASAPGFRVVELGAGDGSLARRLLRRFPALCYEAIDFAPAPADLPNGCRWHARDLFEVLPDLKGDAVIANLFLHHFPEEALRQIGRIVDHFPLIAFCEPWRQARFHAAGYALRLLGINRVTRHDLHVSIDAGFTGDELPRLLGLENGGGRVETTWLGGYRWVRGLPLIIQSDVGR